jgi:hypothetical protein
VAPLHVEGETGVGGGGDLVAVLAGGVRIEGLTLADVVELARREDAGLPHRRVSRT